MSSAMPAVGTTAPQITLQDADATSVSLSEFRGRWVVLYFYPKDNTPGCTTEALEFTALKTDFAARNAVVVGVSPDSCASHRKFIDKKALDVILLSDPDQAALTPFGAWGEKSMYGKTYMGVVRSSFLIDPEGVIREVWPKVKAKGHAQAVLERLDEVAGG